MTQAQVFEGTPDQLAKHLSRLPRTKKYKMTLSLAEAATVGKKEQLITFGMFPQLQALTEEDFRSAEWRGEDFEPRSTRSMEF